MKFKWLLCLSGLGVIFAGGQVEAGSDVEGLLESASQLEARIDRVADLYQEQLRRQGAGLMVLFGLPSSEQARKTREAVSEIHRIMAAAEEEVEILMRAMKDAPEYEEDGILRQRRRLLGARERDLRIPFYRGVGAFFQGVMGAKDEEGRRVLFALAVDRLGSLPRELEGATGVQVALYEGLAWSRLGKFAEAEEWFRRVAEDEESGEGDVFAARMGGVWNRAKRGGAAKGLVGLDSIAGHYVQPEMLFYRMLIADTRFRLQAGGGARLRITGDALSAYTDLLRTESGLEPEALRSLVLMRLHRATAGVNEVRGLPLLVSVARAEYLLGEGRRPEEAVGLLLRAQATGGAKNASPEDRADALFVLGRAQVQAGDEVAASAIFLRLAERYPTSRWAERAIERGVDLALRQYREQPDDPKGKERLHDGLDLLLDRYPNLASIDRWFDVAGRLGLDEGRYGEAIGYFERITPESKHFAGGLFMQVETAHRWAEAEGTVVRYEALRSMAGHHRKLLSRVIDRATGEQAEVLRSQGNLMVSYEARAELELERPEHALELLKELEGRPGGMMMERVEILSVRLSSWGMLDRPEEAREAVEQFLAEGGGEAEKAVAKMLEDRIGRLPRMEDSGDELRRARTVRDLQGLAEGLQGWLKGRGGDEVIDTGKNIRGLGGEAFRAVGDYERALPLYKEAIQEQPNSLRWLFGRAECLFLQEDAGEEELAEAMGIYRRVAAGGAKGGAEYYWGGQVRMLEILDRMGRNTHRILPRIQRLRREDPGLGGERFRRRFKMLQEKYGSRN